LVDTIFFPISNVSIYNQGAAKVPNMAPKVNSDEL
jgi:hypothetical protein